MRPSLQDRLALDEKRIAGVVDGVRQDVIDAADATLEIPQFGSKHSLNVAVSAGVVLWHMTFCHWHGH